MRLLRLVMLAATAALVQGGRADAWTLADLFKPCDGDCAVALYSGTYVEESMTNIIQSPGPPWNWRYSDGDHLIATSISRVTWRFWNHWTMEPEVGLGQRVGRQEGTTEVWGAFFFRYHGFPWDHRLLTTVAISTGMNWASEITPAERDRAKDGVGSQWMHFFSPEITFALPDQPNTELVFRVHHRSGVFGLVSDAWGGAQYATVGFRLRF